MSNNQDEQTHKNKLFSIDEFKKRLHEAKIMKNSLNEKIEPLKERQPKGTKINIFTLNDNDKLLRNFIDSKNNLFDNIYEYKEEIKIESQLSLYLKKQQLILSQENFKSKRKNQLNLNNIKLIKNEVILPKGKEFRGNYSNRSYLEKYKRKI